jgi:hypothetical protein
MIKPDFGEDTVTSKRTEDVQCVLGWSLPVWHELDSRPRSTAQLTYS